MKNIQVKRLSKTAILPVRNYSDDAGLDIFIDESINLNAGNKAVVKTGIAINIPSGYVGLLTGRSGITSKTELMVNLGVIDSGYHGEIKISVKNLSVDTSIIFDSGTKLAQLIIIPISTPEVIEVTDFEELTKRGTKGFGSSGE